MRLGDIVFYITKYTGIKYLVEKYHKYKGTKCKCDSRREDWNKIMECFGTTRTLEACKMKVKVLN